jgi:phage baseplate assembly protein W
MMQIDFPYRIDGRGRTATTSEEEHVGDLIRQVLFTAPGERVNRPTFGSGLLGLVFEPNRDLLAGAIESGVAAALQQWLGELVVVEGVTVEIDDSTITVTVSWIMRKSQERHTAQFVRAI